MSLKTIRILNTFNKVNFDSLEDLYLAVLNLREKIQNRPSITHHFLDYIMEKENITEICEEYDSSIKLTLIKNPNFSVRLKYFLEGYNTKLHNHRWNFASIILKGGYRHYIYGNSQAFIENQYEKLYLSNIRYESTLSFYSLHHNAIHKIEPISKTLTLQVRGPAVKDKYKYYRAETGESWYQYGSNYETKNEKEKKKLPLEHIKKIIFEVKELFGEQNEGENI